MFLHHSPSGQLFHIDNLGMSLVYFIIEDELLDLYKGKVMKKLLILSLFTLLGLVGSVAAMETEALVESAAEESLASEVVQGILKGESVWLTPRAGYYDPRGDVSKLLTQQVLSGTNFKYILTPVDIPLEDHNGG